MKTKLFCILLALTLSALGLSACGVPNAPAESTIAESTESESESAAPSNFFQKGVWSASLNNQIDTYYIFYDETSGRTERADGTGGVAFTCEQDGEQVVFHFGEDDTTYALFGARDHSGIFDFGDRTVVYHFEHLADADADSFTVPAQ